mmetsp:Transcript_52023/g.104339  ORF Transcript_52023/g.104339 Transcript_52023/m.104339 type:complete len:600 (+) Transcript_52023:49-1848(+)
MESDGNRSSTDSPVEVEAPAQALQIIELTEEKDGEEMLFKFKLNEESLEGILNKIPKGMKVAVVSVVGNFRTGKSFLLTFMLRFLRNRDCKGDTWQTAEGESLTEGNANAEAADESEHQSFEWRGGHERMTTGIWMYSEPFLHVAANGETVAVLVVDTQGLFDNEASMLLTSCIFGLSTLMSSHQIYNVKENVSEDHLQNLALFSEYGRMALANDDDDENNDDQESGEQGREGQGDAAKKAGSEGGGSEKTAGGGAAAAEVKKEGEGGGGEKAFQRLEFLVRDWPEVELLLEGDEFMDSYIRKTVMEEKASKDLQETREQITSCFENISCFMLPHPGLAVTRKAYDGQITGGKGLEPEFRELLDRYMRRVFGVHLEPKRIHGRPLTAPELLEFIKTYVALFQGGNKFPEAKTVLQATSEAHTRNASTLALKKYTEEMDATVGPRVTRYLLAAEASALHKACLGASLGLFDDMATMGPKTHIKAARAGLESDMASAHEKYAAMNAGRNPLKGVEPYLLPLTAALVAWLGRVAVSTVCGIDTVSVCANFHDLFSHVYVMCVGLLLITGASNFGAAYDYYKQLSPLLFGSAVGAAPAPKGEK